MNSEMYEIFFNIQKKHWWFQTKKEIVLKAIEKFNDAKGQIKILDIGCGSGLMLNSLEKIGEVSGMDMSDDAIGFSGKIFNGRVLKGWLPDKVPFPENHFDLIVALDVIEHIEDDFGSLESIRKHLKAHGKAIITVPAYMFLWSPFDDKNEHKRRYRRSELKKKLLAAGFKIEKLSYYIFFLFPAVFIVRKLNMILGRDGAVDVVGY
jgi:2-polyprenyl-3-methyl-5-hydroxy-6-metoxy-1,4-benzoquinol methylase